MTVYSERCKASGEVGECLLEARLERGSILVPVEITSVMAHYVNLLRLTTTLHVTYGPHYLHYVDGGHYLHCVNDVPYLHFLDVVAHCLHSDDFAHFRFCPLPSPSSVMMLHITCTMLMEHST